MKERPILFSGEMVGAILGGRKTQTRRVVLPQPTPWGECWQWHTSQSRVDRGGFGVAGGSNADFAGWLATHSAFGQPGDRLWVKETFANLIFERDWESGHIDGWHSSGSVDTGTRVYNADPHGFDDCGATVEERGFAWTPAIFMPRRASRIDLEVVAVRVERVQEMRGYDAVGEGMLDLDDEPIRDRFDMSPSQSRHVLAEYRMLWNSLNAKRGYGWDVNPWVWVIEFKRVEQQAVAA